MPPVRVTWGEESRDQMGSISLIAVAHEESDLPALREDISRRSRALARERRQADPTARKKVAQILSE